VLSPPVEALFRLWLTAQLRSFRFACSAYIQSNGQYCERAEAQGQKRKDRSARTEARLALLYSQKGLYSKGVGAGASIADALARAHWPLSSLFLKCVCVCVCVYDGAGERESGRGGSMSMGAGLHGWVAEPLCKYHSMEPNEPSHSHSIVSFSSKAL
jgi:hypothetical protein